VSGFPEMKEPTVEELRYVEESHALLRRAADRTDVMGQAKVGGLTPAVWYRLSGWLRSAAEEALEVGPDPRALDFARVLLEGDCAPPAKARDNLVFKAPPKLPDW
jgi:HEAT repeat protein